MKKWALILLGALGLYIQGFPHSFAASSQSKTEDAKVIIFDPGPELSAPGDIDTFFYLASLAKLSVKTADYRFINNTEAFFDRSGKRKFRVLIMGGGEGHNWFRNAPGDAGISCAGVKNIMNFIESGGSVIALCICGSALFASKVEWLNPNEKEAQMGLWDRTHSHPGHFKRHCGFSAFKGWVRGPQETNRPYPKKLFLPIRMNLENEIVRGANLPAVIPQIVVGSGSLFPDKDQPFDTIGWYPDGTIAMGVVPYGAGRVVLSNPHPNQTGPHAAGSRWGIISGKHAQKWGWTNTMVKEMSKIIQENPVPNSREEEDSRKLAQAMLIYAYQKGLE
jgi:hypothetical protein